MCLRRPSLYSETRLSRLTENMTWQTNPALRAKDVENIASDIQWIFDWIMSVIHFVSRDTGYKLLANRFSPLAISTMTHVKYTL